MADEKKRQRPAEPGIAPRSRAIREPREDIDEGPDDHEVSEYRRSSRPVRVRRRRWDWLAFVVRFLTLRRVAWLVGVIAVLFMAHRLVLAGSTFVLSSSDQIMVIGGQQVTRDDVTQCFASDLGRNVFYIPLHQRRLDLEAIPWVEHAAVLRLWPDQIQVRLTERVPVAFVRVGSTVELVDAHGVLLQRPQTGKYNFPVLTGLAGTEPASDSSADVQAREKQVALYLQMEKELDSNGSHHSNEFSEIDLHDPMDLQTTIMLNGDPDAIVIHFGHEHFLDRYQLLAAHIQQWQASFTHLTSIDLRYDGQAIINTGSGAPGVATGAAASGSNSAAPRP